MRPYEWMLSYTGQKEWIEGQGVFLWLAFFFVELGAGVYLVSLFLGNLLGILIGWLITLVLGCGCHVLFLGQPLRAWRAFFRPQTSWISRGMIFVTGFTVFGVIQMGLLYLDRTPWMGFLTVLMGILSFLVVIYGGFAMNFVNGIPLWNTPLLPILYTVASLWGGCEVALVIALKGRDFSTVETIEFWIRLLLILFVFLVVVYLWSVRYSSPAGKYSFAQLLKGNLAWPFYLGVVMIGIGIPVLIIVYALSVGIGSMPIEIWLFAVLCGLAGDLTMRYCILKAGYYAPLIPLSPY